MSIRVALITGASRGIGRKIAERLAQDGFHVMLNDLPVQRDSLTAVENSIKGKGGQVSVYLADVSVEAEVEAMVAETVKLFGSLDVVSVPKFVCYMAYFIRISLSGGCKCGGSYRQTIPRE